MNPFRSILIIVMLLSVVFLAIAQHPVTSNTGRYTIVLHGGAGNISTAMPDSTRRSYTDALAHALTIGQSILDTGGTALDAVEQVIRYFETDPQFNAGIGAVYTADGTHELDASIMDGRDLSCGAVAGVRQIAHPISLSRMVMERTKHVLLTGEGAERFAQRMGIPLVPNTIFNTPKRAKEIDDYKKRLEKEKNGTVGCVALDRHGNLAAGTSTGGMPGKMPGRVGDSPIIGAGTYANNKTCAVSGTGWGEKFIKQGVAFTMSALMEFKGMTLAEAAAEIISKRLESNDGGFIAVDAKGNYATPFNAHGMFRGVATSDGVFEVKIWK